MKFFNATSELKELLLLEHIEKFPETTQKEIGEIISAAASMVNVYIDKLEKEGYMERDYQSAKNVNYHISAKGIKRKNYLLISYMGELLDLYRLAKGNIEEFIEDLEAKGCKKVLLYGGGEVAEIMLSVLRDRDKNLSEVVAIIDDDEKKRKKDILGYKVIAVDDIEDYPHDLIVITSYSFEEDIVKRLREIDYPEDRVVRFFRE